jgi:MFS family permease
VFGLAGLPLSTTARITCVFLFTALFGLGETFMAPTVSPLVNSLADDRVRGRANALSSATYSIAFVISPALSTGMIAAGISVVWLGLLCAGCLGTALLGVWLGGQLTPAQNRIEDDVPVPVEPVPAVGPAEAGPAAQVAEAGAARLGPGDGR